MTELERLARNYQDKQKTMDRLAGVIAGSERLKTKESHDAYIKAFDGWQRARRELLEGALAFVPVVEIAE